MAVAGSVEIVARERMRAANNRIVGAALGSIIATIITAHMTNTITNRAPPSGPACRIPLMSDMSILAPARRNAQARTMIRPRRHGGAADAGSDPRGPADRRRCQGQAPPAPREDPDGDGREPGDPAA